jgi:hypothetical protein
LRAIQASADKAATAGAAKKNVMLAMNMGLPEFSAHGADSTSDTGGPCLAAARMRLHCGPRHAHWPYLRGGGGGGGECVAETHGQVSGVGFVGQTSLSEACQLQLQA